MAELWASIQSICLSICAASSSFGLSESSGLKSNQFITMGAGGIGCGALLVLEVPLAVVGGTDSC